MLSRLYIFVGIVAVAGLMTPPAAHAFTFENKDGGNGAGSQFQTGKLDSDKFDLDEQRRQFSKDGSSATPTLNSKGLMEVPLSNGSLQFGVQSGSSSNFLAPGLGALGAAPRNTRQDFERVVTPESLR